MGELKVTDPIRPPEDPASAIVHEMAALVEVYAAATRASLRALGMQARNQLAAQRDELPVYDAQDFYQLIAEERLTPGEIRERLRG